MSDIDDFEVAKSVSDLLKGLAPENRSRVLRWVAESLGIIAQPQEHREIGRRDLDPERASNLGSQEQRTDIRSFIAAKDPKSDNQLAATVAYYYRFEAPQDTRREAISAEILQEATRLAGRNRLGDPGKTLRNAKERGYLDTADRGEYKINSVGENLVAMILPSEGRVTAPKKRARPPARKK